VDTEDIHVDATLDLDCVVCYHFCDFKRASRISPGQDIGIVAPFVRNEHQVNLVSIFIFVLQPLLVIFCIVFICLPGTKCLDLFPIDEYFLPNNKVLAKS
jgi:hypothetical protein